MKLQPSSITPPKTAENDLRAGHFIADKHSKKEIIMAGFCSDKGVALNGGRIGAAKAPDVIRQSLFKLTPDPVEYISFEHIFKLIEDAGNFPANNTELEQSQEKLGEWVAEILQKKQFPLILGGGHETSYGHFLGYVQAKTPVHILNWDAHADVRPLKDGKAHSGSPFYQALEHPSGLCASYTAAGLLRHSLSAAHLKWMQSKKALYYFKGELDNRLIEHIYERYNGAIMVTMDMDALDQTIAPGVSAPAVNGMSLKTWLYAAYQAGRCKNVCSFDLVEMNPEYDRDNQTARVAALTIWYFLKGYSRRLKL